MKIKHLKTFLSSLVLFLMLALAGTVMATDDDTNGSYEYSIMIQKVWLDSDGNELSDDLPGEIEVIVSKTSDGGETETKEIVIDKNNGWKSTTGFDEVRKEDTFKVEEITKLEGYQVKISPEELIFSEDKKLMITITNTKEKPKTGSIYIEKIWKDSQENPTKPPENSSITIKLSQKSGDGVYSEYGQIQLPTDDGEWECTWENVPLYDETGNAYVYKAEEVNVIIGQENVSAGYNVNCSDEVNLINGIPSIIITNTEIPEILGNLTITKMISDDAGAASDKTFYFTVWDENDEVVAKRSITGEDSVTIPNLKPGKYIVTEDDATIEGYVWSCSGTGAVTVLSNQTSEVVVTNTYEEIPPEHGSLTITKMISGGADTASDKTFYFTVRNENDEVVAERSITGEDSVTIPNLKPGKYTVTEDDATIEGYVWSYSVTGEGTVLSGKTSEVVVTNTYEEIPPEHGSLTITKMISGDADAASDKTFDFTVRDEKDEVVAEMSVTGEGSVTIHGLKPGEYTVTENDAAIEGYVWSCSGTGAVTVLSNQTSEVVVTNTYEEIPPEHGSLTITKMISGGADAASDKTFYFTVRNENDEVVAERSITGQGSVTIHDLKLGKYTVTENDATIEGYVWSYSVTGEGTVLSDKTSEVVVTNTYKEIPLEHGGLTITKMISGDADAASDKIFYFTVRDENGEVVAERSITGQGSVTIHDLKPGEYTVTENDAAIKGYVWSCSGTGTVTVLSNQTLEVVVTNTYEEIPPEHGSLKIAKMISGDLDAASDKTFYFTVKNENDEVVAERSITGRGSVTIHDLKLGKYTVTENDATIEGYVWSYSVTGGGTVLSDKTSEVVVTNTYEEIPPEHGSLKITKIISDDADAASGKTFGFTVRDENGEVVAEISITGQGSVTIHGLKPGKYTVTENDAAIKGYVWSCSGTGEVTVFSNQTLEVVVTNTYEEIPPEHGSLKITKMISGDVDAASDKTFYFTVRNENDEVVAERSITGQGSVTIPDLKLGKYTVTENDAVIEGYVWSYSVTGEGTVLSDKTSEVVVTNTYKEIPPKYGRLTIIKAISDESDKTASEKIYTFTVSGPEGYSNTINITGEGSVTLDELIPGEYIVKENNAEISGWTWSKSGEGAVTVVENEESHITIKNTYVKVTPTPTPDEPTQDEPTPTPDEPTPTPVPERPTKLPDPNDPDSPNTITIWEDDTPLSYVKIWDSENEEWIYIPVDENPLGPNSPKTGDTSHTFLWLILCVVAFVSIMALVATDYYKKQKK